MSNIERHQDNTAKKYPGTRKHIHQYERCSSTSGAGRFRPVWKCAIPTCYHWMPPHMEHHLIGRMSICPNCAENFPLTRELMQWAIISNTDVNELDNTMLVSVVLCDNCVKGIVGRSTDIVNQIINDPTSFEEYQQLHDPLYSMKESGGKKHQAPANEPEIPYCIKCNMYHSIGAECAAT